MNLINEKSNLADDYNNKVTRLKTLHIRQTYKNVEEKALIKKFYKYISGIDARKLG